MQNVRAASVQFQHFPDDKKTNLDKIECFARPAAGRNVDLIVLPEMCITGYWHVRHLSRNEAESLSESVPSGPETNSPCSKFRRAAGSECSSAMATTSSRIHGSTRPWEPRSCSRPIRREEYGPKVPAPWDRSIPCFGSAGKRIRRRWLRTRRPELYGPLAIPTGMERDARSVRLDG